MASIPTTPMPILYRHPAPALTLVQRVITMQINTALNVNATECYSACQ